MKYNFTVTLKDTKTRERVTHYFDTDADSPVKAWEYVTGKATYALIKRTESDTNGNWTIDRIVTI